MKINRAYRYELKLNTVQRILLAKHAGCARFAYNWGLAAGSNDTKRKRNPPMPWNNIGS